MSVCGREHPFCRLSMFIVLCHLCVIGFMLRKSTPRRFYPPFVRLSSWSAPAPGYYKCNVDASFSSELGRTSFGMCTRDENDQFVLAKTDWVPFYLPCLEGEATGLLKAIQWVHSSELYHVLFEVDCQLVADRVLEPKEDISEFGIIIKFCYDHVSLLPNSNVSFVRQQTNCVVHNLAKAHILLLVPLFIIMHPLVFRF